MEPGRRPIFQPSKAGPHPFNVTMAGRTASGPACILNASIVSCRAPRQISGRLVCQTTFQLPKRLTHAHTCARGSVQPRLWLNTRAAMSSASTSNPPLMSPRLPTFQRYENRRSWQPPPRRETRAARADTECLHGGPISRLRSPNGEPCGPAATIADAHVFLPAAPPRHLPRR